MINQQNILTPEERLLLSLCRLHFTDDQKKEIGNLMQQATDWDKFVTLSNEHGVIALCWNNIIETGNRDNIPFEYLENLHQGYLKSLARNTRIFDLLKEVLILAGKENIKIVLLKGLALERTFYGNKGLRQMNDLDILVRKEDVAKLRKLLLKNSYKSIPVISPLHKKILPYIGDHIPPMYRNDLFIEIHMKLFEDEGNDLTEELLNEAVVIPEYETYVYYPQYQLFFLYLVKHLDKHEKRGISQLRLYSDLAILLSCHFDQIISKKIFDYVNRASLHNAFVRKLQVLKIFWGISYPDWLESLIEKGDPDLNIKKFVHFLRNANKIEPGKGDKSQNKIIKGIPGIINKSLFLIGYIIPSLDYMKYLNNSKSGISLLLCYPERWWNIITRIAAVK